MASLGISVEPIASVEAQIASLPKNNGKHDTAMTVATAPPNAVALTTRIVSNL